MRATLVPALSTFVLAWLDPGHLIVATGSFTSNEVTSFGERPR